MWSSIGVEEQTCLNNKTQSLNSVSSSSSSSSSTSKSPSLYTSSSSSPSPFSSSSLYKSTPRSTKTMEEVWKDIDLASLQDQDTIRQPHPSSNFRGVILQDFLARPFSKDPPASMVSSSTNTRETALYAAAEGSLLPPPATVLSLNSGCEFHFLDNSDPVLRPSSHLQSHPSSNVSSFSSQFEALASSSGLPSSAKKRVPESENCSGDRRHKRMIKNRESAARSRARKQAYTNELELEVAHLMEENARLKKQQEQLRLAAAAQLPKKHSLHRTSTAPF
ncbi:protein FD [Quercus robur]|uniref:protein FD n=1 Tax=Quercus robur TaxID=38942 RepID=UPI0021626BE5|nr:protein FD [Quercus robur]